MNNTECLFNYRACLIINILHMDDWMSKAFETTLFQVEIFYILHFYNLQSAVILLKSLFLENIFHSSLCLPATGGT